MKHKAVRRDDYLYIVYENENGRYRSIKCPLQENADCGQWCAQFILEREGRIRLGCINYLLTMDIENEK